MSAPDWDKDRLYGRRQNKPLRARPAQLMDEVLPRIAVSPETVSSILQNHDGPAWLEVGFGGGEHLAWHAARNPDTLIIGAEPFVNGVAKLVRTVHEENLENVRICHGDVRPLMTHMPDGALSRIFVLHPDPWPKVRHRKRRMISPAFLKEAARLLVTGGELRVSSDIPEYIRWTLMMMQLHNRERRDFAWTARSARDWTLRPDDWPQTRYEAKALREGRQAAYLSFKRL